MTTSENLKTTPFDDDPEFRALYVLLERAHSATQDVAQQGTLRKLAEEATKLANKIASKS